MIDMSSYFDYEYTQYKFKGFWGCGECGQHFYIPNEDFKKPWCCPFCGNNHITSEDENRSCEVNLNCT